MGRGAGSALPQRKSPAEPGLAAAGSGGVCRAFCLGSSAVGTACLLGFEPGCGSHGSRVPSPAASSPPEPLPEEALLSLRRGCFWQKGLDHRTAVFSARPSSGGLALPLRLGHHCSPGWPRGALNLLTGVAGRCSSPGTQALSCLNPARGRFPTVGPAWLELLATKDSRSLPYSAPQVPACSCLKPPRAPEEAWGLWNDPKRALSPVSCLSRTPGPQESPQTLGSIFQGSFSPSSHPGLGKLPVHQSSWRGQGTVPSPGPVAAGLGSLCCSEVGASQSRYLIPVPRVGNWEEWTSQDCEPCP
ncbi:uncharacterized protein LOC119473287 isoform X1 [Cebus imitator]|uniref:uncharacterized protein LOC119473287 isoform X1 n=1 Tax=Cebus imitator TaxID=2715852 RepID=UPI001899A92C|nr:uncharacterized protein LOC119473287 isoform X1 [Cebus imitator]